MPSKHEIRIGTTFRSVHADSNPLWRVTKSRGAGTWDCIVDKSEPDWAGTRKVFGTEEIQRSLGMADFWESIQNGHRDFWKSRRPGETVHYHDSFGRYVRGVVVDGKDKDGRPARVMKPTALIGNWDGWDLPRWSDAGFYRDGGYHVQKIREGETLQPSSGSMWESPDFSRPRGEAGSIDPTVLEPIDLAPPAPTPEQAEAARLLEVITAIRDVLKAPEGPRAEDFVAQYRRQIAEAGRIVAETDLGDDVALDARF